jgi:hypothetical protein
LLQDRNVGAGEIALGLLQDCFRIASGFDEILKTG